MLHPVVPRTLLWSALATLSFSLAPGAITTAYADEAAVVHKSIRVRIADLDPSRPADAAQLYRLIRRAATQACEYGDAIDQDCVKEAVAAAVSTVNRPLVTALHARRMGPATLRAGAEQSQQTISLRDLDLANQADVAKLYRRIRAAAESVCGDGPLTGTRIVNSSQVHCIAAAMDRAVAGINKPELSAYHRHESAKSGA